MTRAEALREMMKNYDETYQRIYHGLMQMNSSEITAIHRGHGTHHVSQLARILTNKAMDKSLSL